MKIIEKVPDNRRAQDLQRWLYVKQVNVRYDIVRLYEEFGSIYGVRWDYAVFQACLETGFFRFGGDVKPEQNNFAGIGATGGGEPGESFVSMANGVLAHVQHLATYAGVDIPDGSLQAARTRKVKKWILGKATTFEDLAGTWAADTGYWGKIAAIAKEFDQWMATHGNLEDSITWLELNRTPDAEVAIIGYAGDMARVMATTIDKSFLVSFLSQFPNARSIRVAPAGKSIPYLPEYNRGEPGPAEPERPSMGEPGQKRPWIKWAEDIGKIATQGEYPRGFPEGAIIHHTAGRTLNGDHKALQDGPYPCLLIDRDGTVYQPMPLNRWGYHSGTIHHKTHVGIEVCGAGKLSKVVGGYRSWFGQLYQPADVREIRSGQRIPIPGFYHKFTPEQEEALIGLLLYLKNEAPGIFSFDRVIGHDEACESVGQYGRKNDPGGSLSMTMNQLRSKLHRIWEEMNV